MYVKGILQLKFHGSANPMQYLDIVLKHNGGWANTATFVNSSSQDIHFDTIYYRHSLAGPGLGIWETQTKKTSSNTSSIERYVERDTDMQTHSTTADGTEATILDNNNVYFRAFYNRGKVMFVRFEAFLPQGRSFSYMINRRSTANAVYSGQYNETSIGYTTWSLG